MLKDKKILVFGTDNEISRIIVEGLSKQKSNVVFISQFNNSENDFFERITKNYFVRDYYSADKIEDIFKTDLKIEKNFDGVVFGGGIGGVQACHGGV